MRVINLVLHASVEEAVVDEDARGAHQLQHTNHVDFLVELLPCSVMESLQPVILCHHAVIAAILEEDLDQVVKEEASVRATVEADHEMLAHLVFMLRCQLMSEVLALRAFWLLVLRREDVTLLSTATKVELAARPHVETVSRHWTHYMTKKHEKNVSSSAEVAQERDN